MNEDQDIFQGLEIEDDIKEAVKVQISRRLISQIIRLRAKLEVSCYEYEGIDAVKASLLAGVVDSSEDAELSLKLIAPPLYSLVCVCHDKEVGMKKVDASMDIIKEK